MSLPDHIIIDAKGYWWRQWESEPEFWSMVPVNPDNSPIPYPISWYRLIPDDGPSEATNDLHQQVDDLQHQLTVARGLYGSAHRAAVKARSVAADLADDLSFYEGEDDRPGRVPSLVRYEAMMRGNPE